MPSGSNATGGGSTFSGKGGRSIGKMRSRLELQTNTPTTDASGQLADSWATTMTVWADVRPVSMYEAFTSHQLQAEITHRVRIRYSSTLVANYTQDLSQKRVKWGNRFFRIEGHRRIDEVSRWLDLLCVEEV